MNILFLSMGELSEFNCKIANELKNNQISIKMDKFYYLT